MEYRKRLYKIKYQNGVTKYVVLTREELKGHIRENKVIGYSLA